MDSAVKKANGMYDRSFIGLANVESDRTGADFDAIGHEGARPMHRWQPLAKLVLREVCNLHLIGRDYANLIGAVSAVVVCGDVVHNVTRFAVIDEIVKRELQIILRMLQAGECGGVKKRDRPS